jgi:pseudomonalisin/xanthomonalisin
VTLGDTGPYPATSGWDYATGLGTFDIGKMSPLIGKPIVKPSLPAVSLAAPERALA